jgi:CHASE2 domain-containing sensor protein/signal transduction histidine kinase
MLLILACVFVLLAYRFDWLKPLDLLVYDSVIGQVAAPRDPSIVLVTIDDDSLHRYGPWPWPRDLQARLLTQINRYDPQMVAIDVVYSETTEFDPDLVAAARMTNHLALPMIIDTLATGRQHIEVLPFPELTAEADTLGHVHVELDDDAIVRGTYLFQGVGDPRWPHLMLAIADRARAASPCRNESPGALMIRKCEPVRIPFAGPPGTYPQVPATLLLDPQPTAPLHQALADRIVLVGLTASGAGDWVTSPTSGDAGPMSGVEFNANLLSALRYGTTVKSIPPIMLILLQVLLVSWCSLLLPRLKPKQMLFATLVLALAPIALSATLLGLLWLHLPMATVTVAVVLIYPLWSWRRHEIAWQFIQTELDRIDSESRDWGALRGWQHIGSLAPQTVDDVASVLKIDAAQIHAYDDARDMNAIAKTPAEAALLHDAQSLLYSPTREAPGLPGEVLARQIGRLEERAREVREGRAVGLASLGRMTNGVLVLSAFGNILFANPAAARLLGLEKFSESSSIFDVLDQIQPPLGYSWVDIQRQVVLEQEPVVFEGFAPAQTPVFVAAEPIATDAQSPYANYWVLTLSDLTSIRTAEAQREEALAFLSHDIRSPFLSILALIRSQQSITPLMDDINRYASKGLSTSEQFLQLSRLQLSSHFEKYELELEQVLHNAIEQVFFLARDESIDITFGNPEAHIEEGVWVMGNGELLERAFVNLLSNAIKYSAAHTAISVDLTVNANQLIITFADQGYGIPAFELEHIFDAYFRSDEPQLANNRGAGLGLRFVKTVIERHDGSIVVTSEWGQGTCFTITLPRLPTPSGLFEH